MAHQTSETQLPALVVQLRARRTHSPLEAVVMLSLLAHRSVASPILTRHRESMLTLDEEQFLQGLQDDRKRQ